MFEIGDKVRVIGNDAQFNGVTIGDIGKVMRKASTNVWYDVIPLEADWDGATYLTFYPHELQKVEETQPFKKGDLVKILSTVYPVVSEGDIGVITEDISHNDTLFDVQSIHNKWETTPLCFYPHELELIPQKTAQSREQVLENAVIFAQSIFREYMLLHLKKGEAGRFKAASNFAFSNVMENALTYKAD